MRSKISCCLIFVIIFHFNGCICGHIEPSRGINISRNITIHRNGHGRFLAFLSFLKGFHRRKHMRLPIGVSKHWRASFEFELKPQSISHFPNVYPYPSNYYPPQGTSGVTNTGVSSSSNSIDGIFHLGGNQQQISSSIVVPNKITPHIDERDPISTEIYQKNQLDAAENNINSVLEVSPNENGTISERFLRHAVRTRQVEPLEDDEETENLSTMTTNGEQQSGEITITTNTSGEQQTEIATQSQTVLTTTAPMYVTTSAPMYVTMQATVTTTEKPHETDSTIHWDNQQGLTTSSPIPTEWVGYYDYGAHKPDFIEHIEFTTQLDSEDIRYVKHYSPFRPSLPDYPNTFYANFFVPMKYFKR